MSSEQTDVPLSAHTDVHYSATAPIVILGEEQLPRIFIFFHTCHAYDAATELILFCQSSSIMGQSPWLKVEDTC